jgi:hypothetical protein
MKDKLFTQDELNRIVAARLKRERDRLTKEYESSLKRCMAAVHLILHQEMCATMKREVAAETKDPLWSGSYEMSSDEQPAARRETSGPCAGRRGR